MNENGIRPTTFSVHYRYQNSSECVKWLRDGAYKRKHVTS